MTQISHNMNKNRNGTTCVKKALGPSWHSRGISGFTEGIMAVWRTKAFFTQWCLPLNPFTSPFKLPSPTFTVGFHRGNDIPLVCTSIWKDCWFILTVRMVVSPSPLYMRPQGAKRGLFTNTVRHMAHKHITTWILCARTHTHLSHLPVWHTEMLAHMSRKTHTEGEELHVLLHSTWRECNQLSAGLNHDLQEAKWSRGLLGDRIDALPQTSFRSFPESHPQPHPINHSGWSPGGPLLMRTPRRESAAVFLKIQPWAYISCANHPVRSRKRKKTLVRVLTEPSTMSQLLWVTSIRCLHCRSSALTLYLSFHEQLWLLKRELCVSAKPKRATILDKSQPSVPLILSLSWATTLTTLSLNPITVSALL